MSEADLLIVFFCFIKMFVPYVKAKIGKYHNKIKQVEKEDIPFFAEMSHIFGIHKL